MELMAKLEWLPQKNAELEGRVAELAADLEDLTGREGHPVREGALSATASALVRSNLWRAPDLRNGYSIRGSQQASDRSPSGRIVTEF